MSYTSTNKLRAINFSYHETQAALQAEPSVYKEYVSFVKDSFFAYVPFHRCSTWLLELGKTGSVQEIFLSLTYFQLTETFDCSLLKGNQTNT